MTTTPAKKKPAKGEKTTAKTDKKAAAPKAAAKQPAAPKASAAKAPKAEAAAKPAQGTKAAAAVALAASKAAPAETAPAASVREPRIVTTVAGLQQRLHELGYYHGMWDGHFGPLTAQALGHFQYRNGLHPNGEPNAQTLAALGFSI